MFTLSVSHTPATLDACPLNGEMHLRLRAQKGVLRAAKLIYQCNKNYWHIMRMEAPMTKAFEDSEIEYYTVSVPQTDTRFAYIFELDCADGKVRYLSEEGLTEQFDHNLGYFCFFQYVSQFPCDKLDVPQWAKSACCYQIFPERFAIGSQGKDMSYVNTKWGARPTPKSYYGGDLNGICEHMDYLVDLGINVLYMTPVFCSPTNHKYEITDYENVDPAFGGNEALRVLIAKAHENGIRVLLDGVFNHISCRHPFFLDAQKNGEKSPYYYWFFWNADGSYKTFANVQTMPKLNTSNSDVIRYFSDVAVMWMRDYGADGWRLDVSDEMSHRFLRHFREAVFAQNPETIIIGEDWHRAAQYLNGDEYDGLMNYALTKACLDLLAWKTIDASTFRDRLVRLYHTFSIAADEKMLNLLDSHDTDRFLTRAHGDAHSYRTAAAVSFFYPGIPCVYYGDEIGMEGGYDPDCRRTFDWNEKTWDKQTRTCIQNLMALKKQPALSQGAFSVTEENGIVILTRSAAQQRLSLRINATAEEKDGIAPFGFEIV